MIQYKNGSLTVIKEDLQWDELGSAVTEEFKVYQEMDSFLASFYEGPTRPAVLLKSLIPLDSDRIKEIAERLRALRSWILEMSKVDTSIDLNERTRLFYLNLGITPLFEEESSAEAIKNKPKK